MRRATVLAALAMSTAGCREIFPPDCTTGVVYALRVRVQDSVSSAMVASGAQAVVRDGAFADSAAVPANRPDLDASVMQLAGGRPGTYSVTVRKTGYRDWVRAGVRATKGDCHVNPVELTASLQRL